MLDAEKNTFSSSSASIQISRTRLLFPALDLNGQPFHMVLRGAAAGLGDLRRTLSSHPDARQQLVLELQMKAVDAGDKFEDVDIEETDQEGKYCGVWSDNGLNNQVEQAESEHVIDTNDIVTSENRKRARVQTGDHGESDDDSEYDVMDENQENLLFYLPYVQCTCSSWNMDHVTGDIFVTTLRVFFLSEKEDDDLAIDGTCIALHAVDSSPGEKEAFASHHVYCQLVEPGGGGEDMLYTSATSNVAPTQIEGENENEFDGEMGNQRVDEHGTCEANGTIEVYFKPTISDEGRRDGSIDQQNKCQNIFDSLTKLVSLNPGVDSDGYLNGGEGLLSMFSMMAGINSNDSGSGMLVTGHNGDNYDRSIVVGSGGSNNPGENDEGSNRGASEEERQAMLQRLDDMLIVPPQYEIPSSPDAQFDDAEEDEHCGNTEDVDAIL